MKATRQRAWTDEEHGFIVEHPQWTVAQLAEALGRSPNSVATKRLKLRDGWSPVVEQQQPWTPDEDEFLLQTKHMRAIDVAELLGRTKDTVAKRRVVLTHVKGVKFRGNYDPHKVGARPLIAKTCTACGRLLQADWFRLNTKSGSWTSSCARCRDRSSERQNNTDRAKKQREESTRRRQAMTLPFAERAGQPWTGKDDPILSDPDLTVLEKALKLRRSYKATLVACSRNGYRSKVGLGDPERDRWIIDNPNNPNRRLAS